ncbi:MAG: hypothetical protein IJR00_09195 [Lachnospiraceae bacterium]|nr:hypothetical protein [Lachnospiraceae bacterium]
MKDILNGLIGIIAALAIFAGGVIIGAGYLKSALEGAGTETEQSGSAASSASTSAGTSLQATGTAPYYTNTSYLVSLAQNTAPSTQADVPADDTARGTEPVSDAPGNTDAAAQTGESDSLNRLLSDLSDILSGFEEDGIRFELSYNYTRDNMIVFMIPTDSGSETYSRERLTGDRIDAETWERITAEVNAISSALQKGLEERGFTDTASYVQLWDRASDGRNLLTSQNGQVISDYFGDDNKTTGGGSQQPSGSGTAPSGTANSGDTQSAPPAQGSANSGDTQNTVNVQAVTMQTPYNYDFPAHVWLSPDEDFFHEKNGCGHMDPNQASRVTLQQALKQGIHPCDVCFPGAEPGDA